MCNKSSLRQECCHVYLKCPEAPETTIRSLRAVGAKRIAAVGESQSSRLTERRLSLPVVFVFERIAAATEFLASLPDCSLLRALIQATDADTFYSAPLYYGDSRLIPGLREALCDRTISAVAITACVDAANLRSLLHTREYLSAVTAVTATTRTLRRRHRWISVHV